MCAKVLTGPSPSFFVSWWFRQDDTDPTQVLERDGKDVRNVLPTHKVLVSSDRYVDLCAVDIDGAQSTGNILPCPTSAADLACEDDTAWTPGDAYKMFYQPNLDVSRHAWACAPHREYGVNNRTVLLLVPQDMRHKATVVLKDKDIHLLNSTVTDTAVP